MVLGNVPLKKQIFSIPNLMGYFRIILIPIILWKYLTAESMVDYRIAALIIGISGITDFLDGFVARKFNMVTQLGKAIDPIADKLTQIAIVCALSVRFEWFGVVACLLIVKEGFMGIMGFILIRKGKMLNGAKWFGKVSTAVLYVIMFALILIPDIHMNIANGMILVSGILLTLSLVLYIPEYRKLLKE
ncbi:CDP-alcohol phosphatidyltransferase family protein [Faecalimonas sp.]